MATYFAGETVLSVFAISGSTTGNPTLYTVPSGRYAKVFVQVFFRVASGIPQSRTLLVGSSSVSESGDSTGVINWLATFEPNSILFQGQAISIIGAGTVVNYSFVIREYAIP